jgi:uncharacterized iron-regulated membrane protein
MNQRIKKIINQIHLWLGLTSGLVVFVVASTGCLYVFEEEARDIFQKKYFYVDKVLPTKQSLYQISDAILKSFPDEKITQIRFNAKPEAAYIYHTKSKKAISIDPYTLNILGVRNLETDFFNFILDIHMKLKMGDTGEQIIKWNVLIFFVLCISGFILWIPKQKKILKEAITIKWKSKNWKKLSWDLHSVLGFYALFVLLIISLTGIFWMFDSAKWAVSKAVGEKITDTKAPESDSKPLNKAFRIEDAYYASKKNYAGETQTFITASEKPEQPIRVLFRYPYKIVRKQNTFFYDKNTGELLRADLYTNYNAYDYVMRSNYDFHTGRIRVLGIGAKIIYFLASLFAASLPITGFMIWWGQRRKK